MEFITVYMEQWMLARWVQNHVENQPYSQVTTHYIHGGLGVLSPVHLMALFNLYPVKLHLN